MCYLTDITGCSIDLFTFLAVLQFWSNTLGTLFHSVELLYVLINPECLEENSPKVIVSALHPHVNSILGGL